METGGSEACVTSLLLSELKRWKAAEAHGKIKRVFDHIEAAHAESCQVEVEEAVFADGHNAAAALAPVIEEGIVIDVLNKFIEGGAIGFDACLHTVEHIFGHVVVHECDFTFVERLKLIQFGDGAHGVVGQEIQFGCDGDVYLAERFAIEPAAAIHPGRYLFVECADGAASGNLVITAETDDHTVVDHTEGEGRTNEAVFITEVATALRIVRPFIVGEFFGCGRIHYR